MIKEDLSNTLKSHIKVKKFGKKIIADINIQVKARVNNKYYELGDIDTVKDRFLGIMNNFSRACKKNEKAINDFTKLGTTLLNRKKYVR